MLGTVLVSLLTSASTRQAVPALFARDTLAKQRDSAVAESKAQAAERRQPVFPLHLLLLCPSTLPSVEMLQMGSLPAQMDSYSSIWAPNRQNAHTRKRQQPSPARPSIDTSKNTPFRKVNTPSPTSPAEYGDPELMKIDAAMNSGVDVHVSSCSKPYASSFI